MRGLPKYCAAAVLLLIWILSHAAAWAIDSERFSINGFTSVRADKQIDETGYGDPNLSFNAELFDLLMNFEIGEQMRVVSNVSWNHGAEKSLGYTSLEYAFIEQTWFDEIKFRFGKISTPFGLYNEIRLASPAFYSAEIPHATTDPANLFSVGIPYFPKAGVGIAIQGEGTFDYDKNFSYNIFLANGFQDSTLNPYQTDANFSKSLTVRTRFDFNSNLKFGKSIYLDNFAHREGMFLFSDGYDFEFTYGNLRCLGELAIATAFGTGIDSTQTRPQQMGGYLQASYSFENGFTPYSRVESFSVNYALPEFSERAKENNTQLLVLGSHYEFTNWYSLKTEAVYYLFGKGNHHGHNLGKPDLAGTGFSEIRTSLVVGF